jgi:hypothetical protein
MHMGSAGPRVVAGIHLEADAAENAGSHA